MAIELKKFVSGKVIAEESKRYKLLKEHKRTDNFKDKKISFTPVELNGSKNEKPFPGILLGVLENEIMGDETGLPPGTYNLFLTHIDKKWHVYAEANGVVIKEALRVSVKQSDEKNNDKKEVRIRFIENGWGYEIYYGVVRIPGYTGGFIGYPIGGCSYPPYCGLNGCFYF